MAILASDNSSVGGPLRPDPFAAPGVGTSCSRSSCQSRQGCRPEMSVHTMHRFPASLADRIARLQVYPTVVEARRGSKSGAPWSELVDWDTCEAPEDWFSDLAHPQLNRLSRLQ